MKAWFLSILAALSLSGCEKTAKVTAAAPPAPAPAHLPVVAEGEVPSPPSSNVTVGPGMDLATIAAKAYGHAKFSGFLARLNGILDPEKVPVDATLKTPSIPIAFREAGLDARFQPTINVLAKACTDFQAALPAYLDARRASGVKSGTFPIPEKFQGTFLKCADAIDAAKRELETAKEPHQVPRMSLDQFAQASSLLRELSTGSIDGYDYDSDLIGQRFGLGFTNAIIWAQNGSR